MTDDDKRTLIIFVPTEEQKAQSKRAMDRIIDILSTQEIEHKAWTLAELCFAFQDTSGIDIRGVMDGGFINNKSGEGD